MTDQTVFLVDDDPGARDSFGVLMRSMRYRAETFASAAEFLHAFDSERAGCLVLDVRMPEMSGLELQKQLAARDCALPIIILTGHADIPMCTAAFREGAFDFLEKPINDVLLRDAIERALRHDAAKRVARNRQAESLVHLRLLSPREREVMELLAQGVPMKQIARDLRISNQTVAKHRAKVLEKLQVGNDVELVQLLGALAEQHSPPE